MSKEDLAKEIKNIVIGLVTGLTVLSFGYFFYYGPSRAANPGGNLQIEEHNGLLYLVNVETGEIVSEGFESFQGFGNGSAIGTLGEYRFVITIEDGEVTSVSPELESVEIEIATSTGDPQMSIESNTNKIPTSTGDFPKEASTTGEE